MPKPLLLLLCIGVAAACADDPSAPRREVVQGSTVVWLTGAPYEMGFQHGELLREELKAALKAVDKDITLKLMFALAKALNLTQLAQANSYPEVLEECRGLGDGFGDPAWTLEHCLVLNFGDVIVEQAEFGTPPALDLAPGCSQFVAAGKATADGRLYHGRVLDWSKIDFIVEHPVIFVRRPEGGVPHAVVGFPANLSPYQGMNAEGIAVASNEVDPKDNTVIDRKGRSHVQLVGQILARARSLAEVRTLVAQTNHMSFEIVVVSDGDSGEAEVFEMSPTRTDRIGLRDGVLYATNHFQGPRTSAIDHEPAPTGSLDRLARLGQLVAPGGAGTLHGALSPPKAATVLRDRKNPQSGALSPAGTFDDGKSIATNGALYQLVFDPAARRFWLAAGKLPVPAQPLVGFSLSALLGEDDSHPDTIP